MNVLTDVLAVFSSIGDWFVETMTSLMPIFYDATNGLSIIGTLSICALGVGLIMLVINKIADFLKFR